MRRRILATIGAVATLSVVAFFVPTPLSVRNAVQREDLLELQRETAIVASRVPPSGPIDLAAAEAVIERGQEVAVYDREGRLVEGAGPAVADEPVRRALTGEFAEASQGDDLVVAVPVRPGASGPEMVVRVSEPTSAGDRRVRNDLMPLGVAALAVIATAIVVGALLARRLSRPVEQLGHWARTFGRDTSSRQAPEPSGIAELDELRDSLQQADERIRDLLRRERSFSSHVAHQLRTPVAAMRVAVEAELESPRPDATAVLHESIGALDRLESTITSLLALSRHDHGEPVTCDVADVVRGQAERWRSTLATHDRPLDVRGTGVVARIDPAAVRHILDVLLDNALRHGRGRVTVTTGCTDGHVQIDVADEGAAAGQRDPFSEQRGASSHGIGLRLARTLAETQGGRLTLLERPTTVFRLTVPVERRPLTGANRT